MKHAFLVLAHNNYEVIKSLLFQLDDKDFDIYIHINKKIKKFPKEELVNSVTEASIHFVERVAIGYCDYSMVEGMKKLMFAASKSYHDYYHIISGADLMIKTRSEFKKFFEINKGYEFVGFSETFLDERTKYRNYFIAKCRQKSHYKSVFYIKIRKLIIYIQKLLGIENKIPYRVKKGSDWYSITHEALIYILENEPIFKKYFYRAYCPTEFFSQTLLWNSKFKENLYCIDSKDENESSVRLIDWKRGTPYVFTVDNYEEILNSSAMFARKFDETKDMKIVEILKNINEEDYVE